MKTINELKEIIRTNMNVVFYNDMLEALNELERFKSLEGKGLLLEMPCKPGDYAMFPNGQVYPVIYVTSCNDGDINVGCQNGHVISMNNTFKCWGVKFITKKDYESQFK